MEFVPQIIRSRQRRRDAHRRSFTSRLGSVLLVIGIFIGISTAISIVAGTIIYSKLTADLPSPDLLPALFAATEGKLPQPSRILDRSGEVVIAVLENEKATGRRYLSIGESNSLNFSPTLIQAAVAASDQNFWSHPGFNFTWNPQNDRRTIAQKLVADHLLWYEPPSIQKELRERILAAQITERFGRDQILEWYLNSADFGNLTYGADAAARTYFGKSATNLSLAEAAILVAAAENPALNPITAPNFVYEAKDQILREMFDQGLISESELQRALAEEPAIQPDGGLAVDLSPPFTSLVLEQVSQFFPLERITRGGFSLVTTLDFDLQTQIMCSSEAQMERMRHDSDHENSADLPEDCEMGRLLPSLGQDVDLSAEKLASNVVVLDPREGQILALLGGNDLDLDPTRLPGRPPGSILSPFVYLTSFTRGTGPGTQLWDIPASLVEGLTDIRNPDGRYHGPIRLRVALVNDYLVPAVQILSQMGPDQVWRTAQQLGLTNLQVPPGDGAYRLLIEEGEITLLELNQAFGTFANQGVLAGISPDAAAGDNGTAPVHPQVILKVIENSGEILLDCTDPVSDCHSLRRPVITPQLAYLITNILSDETTRWESLGHPNPLEIGRPVAAKIGRTQSGSDTWTVGYTPDLVVGTWIGPQDPLAQVNITPSWSAGLWHAIIQYISRDKPVEEFTVPPGISTLQVCDQSGLLPTEDCPHVVDEVFLNGNEPTHADNLYQKFQVNRETGRLATIFTSPALVDEQVFMVVPPQAASWAIDAGIQQPPSAYDILDISTSGTDNAVINSPSMFSNVKREVPIIGRAAGEGFQSYRLQVGSGLNPSTWLQIGKESREPIQNGELGVWDTSGLSGLYVLQLLVSYQDERVETATIQVTVDNQAPQMQLRYPADGGHFDFQDTNTIAIQAEASDDLELAEVEFFVDGELLATLSSPPFVVLWDTSIGEHVINVRAYDRAGNMDEQKIKITVER